MKLKIEFYGHTINNILNTCHIIQRKSNHNLRKTPYKKQDFRFRIIVEKYINDIELEKKIIFLHSLECFFLKTFTYT